MNYETIWNDILKIRERAPLIHNITNYVVMHSTANALLAIGASPVMAHAIEEVEEMVVHSNALVLNIGTLSKSWIDAMFKAAYVANTKNIPIVVDPVGAGATKLRTETIKMLLEDFRITILRGNASEIKSICYESHRTKGVDSIATSEEVIDFAKEISGKYDLTVTVSGSVDIIMKNNRMMKVHNGNPMMSRVTGMGCIATAITGAFAAVNNDYFIAASEAMATVGIAGEIAAQKSSGSGSLEINFLDALFNLNLNDIAERLKIEIYEKEI